MARPSILTVNAGSSSLKTALFEASAPPRPMLSVSVDRLGHSASTLALKHRGADARPITREVRADGAEQAFDLVLEAIAAEVGLEGVRAVGHRFVHGGPHHQETKRLDSAMLEDLRQLAPLDPDHMPAEIALASRAARRFEGVAQIACFDTTFHATMPRVARLLPLPLEHEAQGIRRYGFHGLSYTFIMEELARLAGRQAAAGRVVVAHLGSGSSLAAVSDGRAIDTTMGFTPTSGVVMGTRTGDLDPGVVLHLLRMPGASVDSVDELLNRKSGLRGVSGSSSDMRDLLARAAADPRARDAIDLYCHSVLKAVGAFAAVLGGVDTLVFAGGIGERASPVRARIAGRLGHLGAVLDEASNEAHAPVISTADSRCTLRVVRTDEESIIARETLRIIETEQPS